MKRWLKGALAVLLVLGAAAAVQAQSVPAAFLLYPNYRGLIFSDRPEILVEAPSGANVTVRDKVNGSTVATARATGAAVRIAATTLQQNHPYTVTVVNGGATIATWDVKPVPASSRASMNISFDPKGRLLMHGKPRFALGVYDNGFGYATDPSHYEQTIFAPGGKRELAGINFNMYLNYHFGQASLQSMNVLMDVLQKHGMMYLQTSNCFNDGSYRRIPFALDQNDSYPTELGKHEASAGFYIMDECSDALIAETKQHHRRLSSLDHDSMTFGVTYANHFPSLDNRKWIEAVDVLGTDPYPLFGAEPAAGYSHFQVADTVAMLANSARHTRPVIGVLQFFKFTTDSRWPTYAEERAHAIMSIVEGAQGLFWWEIGSNGLQKADPATKAQQMANLRSIVNELDALEPVLLAPDAPGALKGNSTRFANAVAGRKEQLALSIQNSWLFSAKRWYQAELNRINAGDYSQSPMLAGAANVRTKVKIVGGKGYVFAYNYTNRTLPATFTWHTAPGSVVENKSRKSFPLSGSSWSDTFRPYESRIYVIGNGGTPPAGSDPTPVPDPDPGPAPTPTGVRAAFTNPASGATLSGTRTITVSATGGSGSYTYRIATGGTVLYSGSNASFSWNTTTVQDGSHTLTATARDGSGTTGTASLTVTVRNTTSTPTPTPAPSFTAGFTAPASGASVEGNLSVGMNTSAPWGRTKTWTLAVDGRVVRTVTNTGTVLWHTLDTRPLTDGSHQLKVSVTSGGATATATSSIRVTNGTPSPAPAPSPSPAFSASFSSPAAGATVSANVSVGMATTVPWGTSKRWTLTVDGRVVRTVTNTGTVLWHTLDTRTLANGRRTLALSVTSGGRTATVSRVINVAN
jgi:hypothetical protein